MRNAEALQAGRYGFQGPKFGAFETDEFLR